MKCRGWLWKNKKTACCIHLNWKLYRYILWKYYSLWKSWYLFHFSRFPAGRFVFSGADLWQIDTLERCFIWKTSPWGCNLLETKQPTLDLLAENSQLFSLFSTTAFTCYSVKWFAWVFCSLYNNNSQTLCAQFQKQLVPGSNSSRL